MRNESKIKAVVLGGVIFFATTLLVQMTAAGIPVSFSYQVTSASESAEGFNASINALSFRNEQGDWHLVRGGGNEEGSRVTEMNIDSIDKIQFSIADASVGSGRLETAVTLPVEDVEIPAELNLKPYQELKIQVEIIADDNLYESNEGTYVYNPHLALNISGKRMNDNKQSELLLKTEIHQNEEGAVMYGPPIDTNPENDTATDTEMMQVEQVGNQ